MENAIAWANELVKYANDNTPAVIGVTVGVLLIVGFVLWDFYNLKKSSDKDWLNANPRRRGKMLRRERRKYVDSLVTDEFTDRVEQLVYDGVLTREESNDVYVRLKKLFPVRNIFPSPELLKEAIRRRMAAGLNEPVPLPDKKIVPKKKHLFDKCA